MVPASPEQLARLTRWLTGQTTAGKLRWDPGAEEILVVRLAGAMIAVSQRHGLVVRNAAGAVVGHQPLDDSVRTLLDEASSARREFDHLYEEMTRESERAEAPKRSAPGAWGARHGPDRD